VKTIVLKPGSTQDQADPGLESGRVEEKTGEEKTRYDLATRSKTRLQPVDFFFFLLKQRRFDFLKKQIDMDDPVTWSKSGTRALDRAGSKNYGEN
jgi:hypothetical protein